MLYRIVKKKRIKGDGENEKSVFEATKKLFLRGYYLFIEKYIY